MRKSRFIGRLIWSILKEAQANWEIKKLRRVHRNRKGYERQIQSELKSLKYRTMSAADVCGYGVRKLDPRVRFYE